MSKLHSVPFLLIAIITTGCAQQGVAPQSPGQLGAAAPAVVPRDIIPYRFSGGTGKASYTAKGKDGTCSGTLTFDDNVVYVDVKASGEVDPGFLSTATLTGSSTCNGDPFLLPETFELKTGSIKSGKINDVAGDPPSSSIFGSFKMTGTVCDATVRMGRWIASGDGSRVQIDAVTITHLKQTLKC